MCCRLHSSPYAWSVSGPCFGQDQETVASMRVCMHLDLNTPCCMGNQILCCQPVLPWKPQLHGLHRGCAGSCKAHTQSWPTASLRRAHADQCTRCCLQSKVVEKGRHLREDLRERWETADNRVVHKIQVCAATWRCVEGCRAHAQASSLLWHPSLCGCMPCALHVTLSQSASGLLVPSIRSAVLEKALAQMRLGIAQAPCW